MLLKAMAKSFSGFCACRKPGTPPETIFLKKLEINSYKTCSEFGKGAEKEYSLI